MVALTMGSVSVSRQGVRAAREVVAPSAGKSGHDIEAEGRNSIWSAAPASPLQWIRERERLPRALRGRGPPLVVPRPLGRRGGPPLPCRPASPPPHPRCRLRHRRQPEEI